MLRIIYTLLLVVSSLPAMADDWPQFRGPQASGVSQATNLPTTWSDEENIAWKTHLPGFGAASPIVLGDRIYVAGYSGYGLEEGAEGDVSKLQRRVTCLKLADGEVVWDTPIKSINKPKNYQGFVALHGYASHTPVTDGEAIYSYFGTAGAVALDMEGKLLWQTDCGSGTHGFGTGASPTLYQDLLIVNANVESGSLIALNKKTGEEVWRSDKTKSAWNTPVLVDVTEGEHAGTQELVLNMKGKLVGYEPATGKTLWTCDAVDDYICPSIVAHDGVIYAIGGRPHLGLAVKAGGRGDVTDSHRLYELDKGSNVSSPVYHQGLLYFVHEGSGIAYAYEAKTGEKLYEKRLEPRHGRIYASPLIADGKLIYVSRDKGAYVLALGNQFELLAHNVIESDDSIFNASPVAADDKLLIRSDKFLYCIENKN